ncbi:hypothetical protein [Rhodococcoides fascians]|uniref:hypothetical protein n=1 Tax=Rhodococcoides fascians TaxID=1828 RepID=UPI000561A284|nr:hypothetical protein [Rhodococcus fascians]
MTEKKSGLADAIDNLTGLQVKRVQSLTGSQIHDGKDYYTTLFAVEYVRKLPADDVRKWGTIQKNGFDKFLEETTTKQVADSLSLDSEDSDPKDKPAS